VPSRIESSRNVIRLERMSLFWRVVLMNAGLLLVAVVVLIISPASISATPTQAEIEVLVGGTALVIALNVLLLRRIFNPLARLTGTMRRVDPHDPGRRVVITKPAAEVAELAAAFNEMLDRLEAERQGSARRALAAQEGERLRVARELHDQVGQTLTGVLLALEEIHRRAPADLRDDVEDVQEAARAGVEQVREIARGLRPGALEELGLRSALTSLANSFTGLRVRHTVASGLPVLSPDQDLAVYRVAQESLTNVARHAHAANARLELEEEDGVVVLRVSDDGCGIPPLFEEATVGGVGGMRERALLAGGRLRVRALPQRGTEVRLDLWPYH
jgi:two-component system sensor histidine kinase UhpB